MEKNQDYLNIVMHNTSEANTSMLKKTESEKIYDWNFAGFPAILGFATLIHFLYPVSNQSNLIGLFAPVNDSINEMLKQGFWAIMLFSLIDYSQLKNNVNNYFVAKLTGLFAFAITLIAVHTACNLLFGNGNIVLYAVPFIAGAAVSQVVTYYLFRKPELVMSFNTLSKSAIVIIAAILTLTSSHANVRSTIVQSNSISELHSK